MTLTASLARTRTAHPGWWVYMLAASAWTGVVAIHFSSNPNPHAAHHHEHASASAAGHGIGAPALLLMVAAMMLPFVAPAADHVARTSFWSRRQRAAAGYVLGFATIWAAFGIGLVVAQTLLLLRGTETQLLAATAAGAALWQGSRLRKRTALRCGSRPALPQRSWRATWRAIEAGGAFGVRCIPLCGPAMTVMVVYPNLAVMLALSAVQTYEWRRGANPFAEHRWRVPAGVHAAIAAIAAVAVVADAI